MSVISAVLIGSGSVLISCAAELARSQYRILKVVSSDTNVLKWCQKTGVDHQDYDEFISLSADKVHCDYIFSIGNFNILPDHVLKLARISSINYHYGPLPEYSGLHAPSWAISNGADSYAVCWHEIGSAIDGGAILKRTEVPISASDTALQLELKCAESAVLGFRELVQEISEGTVTRTPQDPKKRNYFSSTAQFKADGLIDWRREASEILAQIKAADFGPFSSPMVWSKISVGDDVLAVRNARLNDSLAPDASNRNPGGIVVAEDGSGFSVYTGTGPLEITGLSTLEGEIQPISSVIEDYGLATGDRLLLIDEAEVSAINQAGVSASKSESYWAKTLAGFAPVRLPQARQGVTEAGVDAEVTIELREQLSHLNSQENPADSVVAAWCLYLGRALQREDVHVGLRVKQTELTSVGQKLFADHVALCTHVTSESTVGEAISEAEAAVRAARDHSVMRRDQIGRDVELSAAYSAGELNADILIGIGDVVKSSGAGTSASVLEVTVSQDGGQVTLGYNSSQISRESVELLAGQFEAWCHGLAKVWDVSLSKVEIASSSELTELEAFNATELSGLQASSFPERFAQAAEKFGGNPALRCGEAACDYETLNAQAEQFATSLQRRNIGRGDLVGVCLDRSNELVVALLGIFKAGAAYLPIDPEFPALRISQMIGDAEPNLIVTSSETGANLSEWAERCISCENLMAQVDAGSKAQPVSTTADDLAYLIYTSGSTGKPKGVQVTHGNLINFLSSMETRPGCGEKDKLLAVTTISFDIALLELFLPLICGAEVVIARSHEAVDGQALLALVAKQGITMMQATSATWNLMLQSGWKTDQPISKILCGGEVLSPELADQLLDRSGELWNMYGPTETTVWSSCSQVQKDSAISIGQPIANTQLYVLDANLAHVPVGFEGELYIGGDGVALGYHNAPEQTAAAFVDNPYGKGKLYRSGDWARFEDSKTLVVLGRRDSQVKLRGYRIELSDVEASLTAHQDISSALVVSRNDQLLAYCIRNKAASHQAPTGSNSEATSLQEWSTMWSNAYESSAADPKFNLAGWRDSYDGSHFSEEEMRDWQAASVDRILSQSPQHVLEIGAGTGLMLFPLAEHCASYHAIDSSEQSIELLKMHTADLSQVRCEQRLAHDLPKDIHSELDTVIINSVAQYFPNAEYLKSVVCEAASLIDNGRIILGDVRNLDWIELFHLDIEQFKSAGNLPKAELKRLVEQAVASERELLLSPDFFGKLQQDLPEISRVEITLRDGLFANEMSRYRFDVVLHIGNSGREPAKAIVQDWSELEAGEETVSSALSSLLVGNDSHHIRLKGIGNSRLHNIFDGAQEIGVANVTAEPVWGDYITLRDLAEEHGYKFALVPNQDGSVWTCDAVFWKDGVHPDLTLYASVGTSELSEHANVPVACQPVLPSLSDFLPVWLERRLPGYMIPDFYVELDQYPLTPNGKVDRNALPDPLLQGAEPSVLPKNEMEQKILEIWAKVLGHDRIGANVSFFKIGGNSLRVVQVQKELQELLDRPVSTSTLYEFFTIKNLAAHLTGDDTGSAKTVIKRRSAQIDEPIAIIGMSCRLPGDVKTPQELWEFVERGGDGIIDVPADRWDANALFDPDPDARGKSYCRAGGFVTPIDLFDAAFFGISPREARALDPAQRLMLETSWEAFERAGYTMDELRGSSTGVFIGIGKGYHEYGLATAGGLADLDGYYGTGSAGSTMSGRVSYSFGLEGPSMTIDTACSSSLVATHLACNALRENECDLALASGVTLMLSPDLHIEFSRLRGMSSDGRCKSFSSTSDGTGWSEGSAVAILKRLSDAQRDGDPIHAIIRGTSVNHAGHSASLTTPSGPAQQRVIRQALANSDLEPQDIDYLEAHGTGTKLGDPIEATSLATVFGQQRKGDEPLWVGSIKSNLGHTQAAAGLAGVFKTVLALENDRLPKTLHVEEPTPSIDWAGEKMALVLEEQPWLPKDEPRRAGVSSFGIGGTNAHVVIEEPPKDTAGKSGGANASLPETLPFIVSGFTEDALKAQADALHLHLGMNIQDSFGDIAASLATTRSHFRKRIVFMAKNKSHLLDELAAFARTGETPASAIRTSVDGVGDPKVAMLFTGQGSQLAGMGKGLYETYPVFRQALDEITSKFDELEKPLLDVIFSEKDSDEAQLLNRTDFTQPALFAIEVALYRLWNSWGSTPQFLMGHSIGEIAAAHVAGVFDLDDACKLVAARGRLMEQLPAGGGMASIQATEQEVEKAIQTLSLQETLSVAGLNAPEQTVVSGLEASVDAAVAYFLEQNCKATKLVVSHAFHSYLLDAMLADYRDVAVSIKMNAPQIPLVSTVTGDFATPDEMTDPEYWVRQARQAVRFNDGMQTLKSAEANIFVELGPQPVLSGLGVACLDGDRDAIWIPSLNKKQQDHSLILNSLSQLHVSGVKLDWAGYFHDFGTSRVDLPTYAFQKEHYWIEESSEREVGAGLIDTQHQLLGGSTQIAGTDTHLFSTVVSADEPIWVNEHKVMDAVLMPGTAFIEMMRMAGNKVDDQVWDVSEVIILAPMILQEGHDVRVQITVGGDIGGTRQVQIYSMPDSDEDISEWQLHAESKLIPTAGSFSETTILPPAGAEVMDVSSLYSDLEDLGYGYGQTFQGIVEGYHVGSDVWAKVTLPENAESSAIRYGLHPALLDAAMHSLLLTQRLRDEDSDDVFVPFEAERLTVNQEGLAQLWVRVASFEMGDGEFWASLDLFDTDGNKVGRLERLHARRIDRAALRKMTSAGIERYQFNLEWQKLNVEDAVPQGTWGVLSCGDVSWSEDVRMVLEQNGLMALDILGLDEAQGLDGVICLWDSEDGQTDEATMIARTHEISQRALEQLHELTEFGMGSPVIWITRNAVGTSNDDHVNGLDASALWGLGRTARNEYLDLNIRSIDLGPDYEDLSVLPGAVMQGEEPEIAIRKGEALIPQINKTAQDNQLVIPDGELWHLEIASKGRLDEPLLVKRDVETPLVGHEVRIEVKATGVNFLDVLNALGMVEIPAFGLECAGVITHVGPDVKNVAVGDAVMGLAQGSFASHVITDARSVTQKPENLSFEEAATIPMTFLTAWYGLHVLGNMQPGEKVLIHAAAGGVGMAAVQLAQLQGAEVFATASEPKWDALREAGLADDHFGSSRNLDFVEAFKKTSGSDKPFDVVLNSLASEFIDASLGLLSGNNSRFLEMGKIDLREQAWIDENYPGVTYTVYNLPEAGVQRIQEMLLELAPLFATGKLKPLPIKTFPINRASDALRFIAQAKHIGKVVLTPNVQQRMVDPSGAVLVTGGVGGLGQYISRWLVAQHGVKDLVLTSRRGLDTAGAQEFAAELQELGARVDIIACDVADEASVKDVIALFGEDRSLRGVVHTAGVLDDGMLDSMTAESLGKVYLPKVDGAWHLHQLTRALELDFFVVYSSISGIMGTLGQGNYAAANSFLDALAHHRRAIGLPATSIAWGAWDGQGMATKLSEADKARFSRQGMDPLSRDEGLELFDRTVSRDEALGIAAAFDLRRLRRAFEEQSGGEVPPLFRTIFKNAAGADARASGGRGDAGLRKELGNAQPEEYEAIMLRVIKEEVAKVLEFASADEVDVSLGFQDLGLDSLTAVLMRNQLGDVTGLALPAKVAFDHPNLKSLSSYLLQRVIETGLAPADDEEENAPADNSAADEVQGTLTSDGTLDTAITFANVDSIKATPESVFLTGGTGFVGAFLLNKLLRKDIDVFCLVRAANDKLGTERLRDALETYDLWEESFEGRLHPVCGDLSKPLFGLREDAFDSLADSVDSICHAGAIVDWMMPLSSYLDTNVGGTHEALKLSARGHGKPLHFVSTYATLPKHLGYHVAEDYFDYGYLTTKFMAENLVSAAQWRGAKAAVYRLPFIGASVETGRFRADKGDFLHNLISGCVELGQFPDLGGDLRGIQPVDYIADVISSVAVDRTELIGASYDFANPHALSMAQFANLVRETGRDAEVVSYEDWHKTALERADTDKTGAFSRIATILKIMSKAELEEMLLGYPMGPDVFGGEVFPSPQMNTQSTELYLRKIEEDLVQSNSAEIAE